MFLFLQSPRDVPFREASLAGRLSIRELEALRERIHRSIDRTEADLDRIEALLTAAKLREERRRGESGA
jgi:hypothetical protein